VVIEVVQSHRQASLSASGARNQRKGVEEDSIKCLGILGWRWKDRGRVYPYIIENKCFTAIHEDSIILDNDRLI
jgi:hypothetical protein